MSWECLGAGGWGQTDAWRRIAVVVKRWPRSLMVWKAHWRRRGWRRDWHRTCPFVPNRDQIPGGRGGGGGYRAAQAGFPLCKKLTTSIKAMFQSDYVHIRSFWLVDLLSRR